MEANFPWLAESWRQLTAYKNKNLIPAGLLFTGPEGIGESAFIQAYAQFILCQQGQTEACGKCRSCILFKAGNHPDFFYIQPEETSATIKIDQIRELTSALDQTSLLEGFQVAIISLAEEMNKAAANALLKTLEEPRGKVLILLLTHQLSSVPATVRSRCQVVSLPIPTKAQATEWLKNNAKDFAANYLSVVDNLPLKALEYANKEHIHLRDTLINYLLQIQSRTLEPISAAAECLTTPHERLQFLATLGMDMIRIKYSANGFLNHHDKITALTQISRNVSLNKLFEFLDEILEASKLLKNRTNVNLQLLMEKIFIKWRYSNDFS